ncbi:MAG: 3-deoxy-7-phosphoheptulonate synthase [Gemmatimonadetes bacterium]|uniref:3-deoxy-7-phosphoheptulonate synthase n=1 Tax=Candidatus Kutchimonas denitrificans TaxID=3056748 RepID=A0AAE4Z659_9BACT|nr:3-deoxy-7-phosphoheptulonate synthase [Gemmatimonadota bacterium]NIR74318.1 3-deoxy-7-phosphoheptulonate synthase [Candidatus Kutchimonas denitrificans]NIS01374.1 3-deoxy-7-phosphoheptulonate synthase [Gemmatimonadota bacterium]NIT67114.1 3-deoxy-7-phosphoheptulonate synthase [Gemmatimonadota bacterium]NIU52770.1 3-deoxy-7-phosphoheptulonate synthase [Gemmatimonadota bacterium]
MIVVMEPNASEGQVADVVNAITRAGFNVRRSGMDRVVLGVYGVGQAPEPELIAGLSGIAEVSVAGPHYRLVSRAFQPEDSRIELGNGVVVGGEQVVVMAGPCSVEDEETVNRIAEAVAKAGAHILRGGAYKPRTSPYAFQGLGEEGLYLLRQAADAHGLLTISEVMEPSQIPLAEHYCNVLQIGARNMQNFTLLRELGRSRRPVMLKRGPAATLDEWLAAAEYIASCGNPNILLCERGIRTFETATRNTFDLSAIPVAKSRSHLPVVADPSHGTGVREHVLPMARAAIAAGADAIMVEVHVEPEKALSDGAQSLTPPMFQRMMAEIRDVAAAVNRGL